MSNPPETGNQPPANLTKSTLSAMFWMFSGTGFGALLQFVVTAILARLLSPADFGVVSAAMVVVAFANIFSELGVSPVLIQRPMLEEKHLRTGFTFTIVLGWIFAGILWLIAPLIAQFFAMADLADVLRVICLLFPIGSLSVVAESLLHRNLQFRSLKSIDIASYALGYGLIGILAALGGAGVWALVAAILCQTTLKSGIALWLQPHAKRPQFDLDAARDLLYLGGGFTLVKISNQIATQGDNVIVGRWLGPAALGFYGRAYNLMRVPVTVFGSVLDKVLFPAMAKVQEQPKRLGLAFRRGMSLIALVILPVSVGCYILAPQLILVILGPNWDNTVVPFRVLVVGMLFRTSYRVCAAVARATGSAYQLAWRNLLYAVMIVVGALAGTQWGIGGVSVGVLVALMVYFIVMVQLSLQVTSLTWAELLKVHLPGIFLAIIVALVAWPISLIAVRFDYPAVVVLGVTFFAGVSSLLLLIWVAPKALLGDDGLWIVHTLLSYVPKQVGIAVKMRHHIEQLVRPTPVQ